MPVLNFRSPKSFLFGILLLGIFQITCSYFVQPAAFYPRIGTGKVKSSSSTLRMAWSLKFPYSSTTEEMFSWYTTENPTYRRTVYADLPHENSFRGISITGNDWPTATGGDSRLRSSLSSMEPESYSESIGSNTNERNHLSRRRKGLFRRARAVAFLVLRPLRPNEMK